MPSPEHSILISMSPHTVAQLVASGYVLYAFFAVRCSDRAGAPVVWRRTEAYSLSTQIDWDDRYSAYTSSSPIVDFGLVWPGFSAAIDYGEILNVGPGGIGEVTGGGPASAMSLLNETTSEFTCGLETDYTAGGESPVCVFPLYGGNMQIIAPTDRVLVAFSTVEIAQSAVAYHCYGPGLLVDDSGVDRREVAYDIDTGWSWNGGKWATPVGPNAPLVPLLIEPWPKTSEAGQLDGTPSLRRLHRRRHKYKKEKRNGNTHHASRCQDRGQYPGPDRNPRRVRRPHDLGQDRRQPEA